MTGCYICHPDDPAYAEAEGCEDCFNEFASAFIGWADIDGEPVAVFRTEEQS